MKKINKLFSYLFYFIAHPKKIKFFFLWIKYSLISKKLPADTPWIPFEARNFLDTNISKQALIFEWGSGGSTIFFSKRSKNIISIEHDKSWYERVKHELADKNISNCEYFLVEPEHVDNINNIEKKFKSSDEKYRDFSFKKYCDAINNYPDNYFDLIFIDGRARNGCIENACKKIKTNGMIVLDNSDRTEYDYGKFLLRDFEQTRIYGPGPSTLSFWETIIFKKL